MGLIIADKIDYNFETKNFKISMFDDKAVKMKVIQWAKSKSSRLRNTKKKLNLFYKWKIFQKVMAD